MPEPVGVQLVSRDEAIKFIHRHLNTCRSVEEIFDRAHSRIPGLGNERIPFCIHSSIKGTWFVGVFDSEEEARASWPFAYPADRPDRLLVAAWLEVQNDELLERYSQRN